MPHSQDLPLSESLLCADVILKTITFSLSISEAQRSIYKLLDIFVVPEMLKHMN
jgi:hypothetical protein